MPWYEFCTRKLLFREAVIAFASGENYKPYEPRVQKEKKLIGRYCGGKYVGWCSRTFGEDKLPYICRSCPN